MKNHAEKAAPAQAASDGDPGNLPDRIKIQIAAAVVGKSAPMLLAVLLLGSVAVWIAGRGHESRFASPTVCVVLLLVVWQLARTGRVLLAANTYIAILCMSILVGMILNGGVRAPIFSCFLPILAMMGWLYGHRLALAFLVAVIAAGAIFVWLDSEGWLRQAPAPQPMLIWVLTSGSLAITLCVTAIPHRMLHRSLAKSETTRRKLEATTRDLAESEKAMWESERMTRAIFDLAHGFVGRLTPAGAVVDANRSGLDFAGIRLSDIVGKPFWETAWWTHSTEMQQRLRAAVQRAAAGELVRFEATCMDADGNTHTLDFSLKPVADETGRVTMLIPEGYDITARKRAEEELKAAKILAEKAQAAAESASKAKDQFIAVLSHELRTPLTPVVAAMSLLRRDVRLPGDVREDMKMINRNMELEVRLIDDLLDVSRVISGKLHMEKRLVDVAVVIREAAEVVSADLDAKGQTLAVEIPGMPYLISADAARLQQVFWNLLRNSIKFSPPCTQITMRAKFVPADPGSLTGQICPASGDECPLPQAVDEHRQECQGSLTVEIIDQGSGIDAEAMPRLFSPFEQEGKARSFGGLGLGLSICKAVVEMHGGSISAFSKGVGCGATFTVRLPVTQGSLQNAGDRPVPSGERQIAGLPLRGSRPLRILLVEDHVDTAKLVRRLLMTEGHDVTTVETIADGLATVRSARPDLLISDLGLPDGSGLDLMRQLLAEGQRIPAIAFSGYGTPGDIEKSKAAGFAEHLIKPISVDALTSAIERLGFYGGVIER
ncbi:MAG: ATP-binding protein [Bacillota bacterium]